MSFWLAASLFALAACAVQRLLSKVALTTLGTRKFYLLSAAVSLLVYLPYLIWRPPAVEEFLPAFGLACLMAVTFGVTTEAIRRGPLGAVSPITALSPALTALLAIAVLRERLGLTAYLGLAMAPIGIFLVSVRPSRIDSEGPRSLIGRVMIVCKSASSFVIRSRVVTAAARQTNRRREVALAA